MTSFEKMRRYRTAEARDAAIRAARTLDVFLAGPFIDVREASTHADNSSSAAKKLRFFLYERFEQLHHVVYLGEDAEMRTNGVANFGSLANAVVYERSHIKRHLNAVVVLPDSPGSFCEIGDWASDPDICKSLILIIDASHEGKLNYINEGIVRLARSNGAEVRYLDYSDHAGIAAECESFLTQVSQKLEVDELYGRR